MKQSEHTINLELGGHFEVSQASKPFIILMNDYTDEDAIATVLGAVGDWFHHSGIVLSGILSSMPEFETGVPTPHYMRRAQNFPPVTGWKFYGKFVSADLPEDVAERLALELTVVVSRRLARPVDFIFNSKRCEVLPE